MKMKTMLSLRTTFIPAVSLLALLTLSCGQNQIEEETTERVVSVKATVVHPTDRMVTRGYTASLEGRQQAVLRARLSEEVTEVRVSEGQKVAEDEIILTLDKFGPTSQYPQTQSQYTNAKKNFEKMEFLFREGAISELEYDASLTQYEVAKAQFDAVGRMVEIHSPIAGTVTSVTVSPGDLVQAGQELATVATTGALRVKFWVNAEEIAFFKEGAEIIVSNDATDKSIAGHIVNVASSADPVSRSFQIEGLLDNGDRSFAPGMFVHVDYVLRHLPQVLTVPRDAIVNLEGEHIVFAVVDGRAERREITLGNDLVGDVEITSGLAAGDTLVTLGQDYLESGVKLNLTDVREQTQ